MFLRLKEIELYLTVAASQITGLLSLSYIVGVLLGVIFVMVFVSVTQKMLTWSIHLDSLVKIFAILAFYLIFAFVIVFMPLYLILMQYRYSNYGELQGKALVLLSSISGFAASSSLITFLASIIFMILAAIMLCHKLIWPMISRPVYAFHRYAVFRNSKLLLTLALLIIGYVLGYSLTMLKDIRGLLP